MTGAELQDRILGTFHYALKPGGILYLGASESIARNTKYFKTVDNNHRGHQ